VVGHADGVGDGVTDVGRRVTHRLAHCQVGLLRRLQDAGTVVGGVGANWSAALTVAGLDWGSGGRDVGWSCRGGPAPLATLPTFHRPVRLSYVPWLGVSATKDRPPGSRSVTRTLLAASGPALVRVTV